MAEKYSLKLKYSLKYRLKLIYSMSDSTAFFCSLFQGSYSSGKIWKKGPFLKKKQGKPGKLREFSDHFYNLKENSGNFILPNIFDQVGGAYRINEVSK